MNIINNRKKEDGSYLGAINFKKLPFIPKRVFYVSSGDNDHCIRGNHAHHLTRQILICISGVIRIRYENQSKSGVKILSPGNAWMHENLEWAEIEFLEKNSILLSLCSEEHREEDYIHDYENFLKIIETDKKIKK